MEKDAELPPSVFYRNLVAWNTREVWRVRIVPPTLDVTQHYVATPEESVVALRIIPNYAAPYQPVVFCVGDTVLEVAFEHAARSQRQTEMMQVYQRHKLDSVLIDLRTGAQLREFPVTCAIVLLVRQVLAQLQAPSCVRELEHILRSKVDEEVRVETLRALSATRYKVLDTAWLYAIKWARQRSDDQQAQLLEARTLFHKVRQAYTEANAKDVRSATEKTLRNILEDYYRCVAPVKDV